MLHYEVFGNNQRLAIRSDLPCGESVRDVDRGRSSIRGAVSRMRTTASIVGAGRLSTMVWRPCRPRPRVRRSPVSRLQGRDVDG